MWAQVYLEDHSAELIPEALANARAMIARGALGKRAQRALLRSEAQTGQGLIHRDFVVQISCTKWSLENDCWIRPRQLTVKAWRRNMQR